jgi:murein DD-endopeptidase MepM/ murein hydrolase activator NlpD
MPRPTMAPLAVAPATLQQLPPAERRRWVIAAAVTGVMLTSNPMARSEIRVSELPGGTQELVERHAAGESAFGAINQPKVISATAVSATSGDRMDAATARETLGAALAAANPGALPNGPVELATYGDVRIVTEGSRVELVSFHESSSSQALPFESSHAVISAHPAVESDAPDDDTPVIVLPTRQRVGAPTSAIDLAMTPGEQVVAPLSGEVIAVDDFSLYGRTPDVIVKIRSSEDPSVVLRALHMVDPLVEVGDRVEAGVTPIAAEARQLPFESQMDRFTAAHRGQAAPHVHFEMRKD